MVDNNSARDTNRVFRQANNEHALIKQEMTASLIASF